MLSPLFFVVFQLHVCCTFWYPAALGCSVLNFLFFFSLLAFSLSSCWPFAKFLHSFFGCIQSTEEPIKGFFISITVFLICSSSYDTSLVFLILSLHFPSVFACGSYIIALNILIIVISNFWLFHFISLFLMIYSSYGFSCLWHVL